MSSGPLAAHISGIHLPREAAFSYDELDVGDVFVESVHKYEAAFAIRALRWRRTVGGTSVESRALIVEVGVGSKSRDTLKWATSTGFR